MRKLLLWLIGLLFAVPAVADLAPCRNLFDKNASYALFSGYLNNVSVGQNTALNDYDGGDKTIIIKVVPNTTYTVTRATNLGGVYDRIRCAAFTRLPSGGSTGVILYNVMNTTQANATFTTLSDTQYVAINVRNSGEVGNDWTQFVDAFQLEEGSTATDYVPFCSNGIKIATTAYNSARFSPVMTELNNTITTIRSVVTNTINQTKAIADLQATKQTRPDETCPAGKKCLLVEDNDGTPHWYEIIENAYGLPSGYTGLEYLQSTGTQWIDTGIVPNADLMVEYTFQRVSSTGLAIWFGSSNGTGADYPTDTQFWTESNSWNIANCVPTGITPSSANGHRCVINGLDKNKHTVTFNRISDGKVLWDGSVIGAYLPYETSNNKSMYLGISNHPDIGTYNKFTQNIYGARFTNKSTGNLVANFVPAKNSSGVIGMYDTVSGQFFTNAGTGTFVAGPVVQ